MNNYLYYETGCKAPDGVLKKYATMGSLSSMLEYFRGSHVKISHVILPADTTEIDDYNLNDFGLKEALDELRGLIEAIRTKTLATEKTKDQRVSKVTIENIIRHLELKNTSAAA